MTEPTDWNARVIAEFRANAGRVGGQFTDAPLLLLHSTGAKSGEGRVNPMMYQELDHGFAVFASKGGAPTNPDCYHNLLAHPHATVEVGTNTIHVVAHVAHGDERHVIWERQKQAWHGFAEYEANTTREIPVIVLEPTDGQSIGSMEFPAGSTVT